MSQGILGLDPTSSLELVVSMMALIIGTTIYITKRPTRSGGFLFERLKPGLTILREVKEERLKNPGDMILHLQDKRKYLIASGKVGDSETLEVPKDVKIRKGWRHFWWLEGDKIVKLGWSLLSPPSEVMDQQTMTTVTNRRTAGKLSTKNLAAGSWTMIILAAGAAFAFGYIVYPMFNHPAPVIEYCRHFANGTIGACSYYP